jgi:hypothetical protein
MRFGSACHRITRDARGPMIDQADPSMPSRSPPAGRAISRPITPAIKGVSRSLPDPSRRRSGCIRRQMVQIPKLTVQVQISVIRCMSSQERLDRWAVGDRQVSVVLIPLVAPYRGLVRGLGPCKLPARPVLSVLSRVASVQVTRSPHPDVLMVRRRSTVRFRKGAPARGIIRTFRTSPGAK